MEHKNWLRLDNAAKIYPAAQRRSWSALFRLSVDLKEDIDPALLSEALKATLERYPSFRVSMKRGLFWFYLDRNDSMPPVQPDVCCPCPYLNMKRNSGFCLRVRYYQKRIAVEFFHVLTDGTGGLSFLKTLTAEYLRLKKEVTVSGECGILLCSEAPDESEMRDSFLDYAGDFSVSRSESDSFKIKGKIEKDNFVHLTCGVMNAAQVLQKAKEKQTTVTEYLTAVMIEALLNIQQREVKNKKRLRPVKICVPVNLRRFFPSKTVRNFASYVNPGVDPRMGEYTFDEILQAVRCQMGTEVTRQMLGAKFSANVRDEKNLLLRFVPLALKNMVMKTVFRLVGDRKTSTNISNLGILRLPPELEKEVTRADFILGPLSENPVACGVLTYGGKLRFNITRTICDPKTEREFFSLLVQKGIEVEIQSNLSSRSGE